MDYLTVRAAHCSKPLSSGRNLAEQGIHRSLVIALMFDDLRAISRLAYLGN